MCDKFLLHNITRYEVIFILLLILCTARSKSISKVANQTGTTDYYMSVLISPAIWYKSPAKYMYTAVQSQKAVSAYFTSEQILPFAFVEEYKDSVDLVLGERVRHWPNNMQIMINQCIKFSVQYTLDKENSEIKMSIVIARYCIEVQV